MPNILVVDDTNTDRALATGLLRKAGATDLLEATNGLEALDVVDANDVALVVTDIQMPEMDGFELVTSLRSRRPDLPVVLMTAKGSEEIAVRALQAGAASYVPKAALQRDLVTTLERVLGTAHAERERRRLVSQLEFTEARFHLENDLDTIVAFVGHLRDQLAQLGLWPTADLVRFSMALQEALFNAYYHGNLSVRDEVPEYDPQAYHEVAERRQREPEFAERRIHVHVRCTPEEAVYTITDEGKGFHHTEAPDPDDPANMDVAGGRGLRLMRTFLDDVRFNEAGNEVTLVVRRRT